MFPLESNDHASMTSPRSALMPRSLHPCRQGYAHGQDCAGAAGRSGSLI